MAEREVTVGGRLGLHARVAMKIADLVSGAPDSVVSVIRDDQTIDASSIMQLITLAAMKGTKLTVRAAGTDAERLVDEISAILTDPSDGMD